MLLLMVSVVLGCTGANEEVDPNFDPTVYFHTEDYYETITSTMYATSYEPKMEESDRKTLYGYLNKTQPGYVLKDLIEAAGGPGEVLGMIFQHSYTLRMVNNENDQKLYFVFQFQGKSYRVELEKMYDDKEQKLIEDYQTIRADKGLYDFLVSFRSSH